MTAAPLAVPVPTPHEWFGRRTHRADDFDLLLLAAEKAAHGTTVSVVLPARNEVGTVHEVVRAVAELRWDLVDEIIVRRPVQRRDGSGGGGRGPHRPPVGGPAA